MSNQNIDWEKGNIQEPNQINWDKGEISPPLNETKAKKGFLGQAKDLGLSALKGTIAVPESVVGIMDTMSYGTVGKTLENKDGAIGFRPNEAKQTLSNLHTDQYKAQQQEFADAGKDGGMADKVVEKTKVALKNPSLIANSIVESVPSIIASGAIGRATGIANPVVAGAVGEGLSMAGSQAEQIRQNTVDGNLTADQSLASVGTGALGSLFSLAGGRVAQKLGIGDANTLLAGGRAGAADIANEIASMPAKSVPRKVIEGALHEGLLEELPQSVSEQILQNLALSKPWSDGIEDAAVMGTLAGMAMGAAAGPMHGGHSNNQSSNSVEQDSSGQTQNSDIPQLGMRDQDQAIDGEYIPRQDMSSQDPQQRTTYTYDQQSTDAENLLGNNNSNFGAPDDLAGSNPSDIPPNGPNTPTAPNGSYFDAPQKPSEQMGIDPNNGPMSSAAALALDSGASSVLQTGLAQEQQTQGQTIAPLSDAVPSDYRQLMESQNNGQSFGTGFENAALQQGNTQADNASKSSPQSDNASKSLPQQNDTHTAKAMAGQTETNGAATAQTKTAQPILGADGQNKWFGSQEKAQAFIDNKKLSDDYQVTQADKSRFEITPKLNESATPATVKPTFNSNQAVGSVGYAQDVAKQAVQQYQGDKSTLEDPKASLTGKGSATDLIYYKNSPSFSDVQVEPNASGDKAIVKLTSAKTGRIEQREYPSSLIDFNNFLEGTNNNASKTAQDNSQNGKTETQAASESSTALDNVHQSTDQVTGQEVHDPQDQITALENQLSNEKNVVQKTKLRKQINELKANLAASAAKDLEVSAHTAATSPENNLPEPTQAQKEAGNYKKGHVQFHGLDISVENPRGSDRTGQRPDGTEWRHTMTDHYGYIKKTMGADGDHVDSYIGSDLESQHVYVVDQVDQKTGKFDEHKVMLGFNDQNTATKAYQANFDKGWKVGHIRAMTMNGFKQWLKEGDTTKPSAEFDDKTETVTTAAGRDLQVRPKVVEASDLIVSNTSTGTVNEAYPQELQPRDRTRLASLHQINSIANDLKPNLLGKSPSASHGAPIVSSDNIVESGNGRTLAIAQAYAQGKAEHYRNWLKSEGHDITGMKHPVLVRERMTPMSMQDRMDFTKEANTSNTLNLSATEQAQSDASKLNDVILSQYQGGDLTLSKNLGFVRQFMSQVIGHTEAGNMILDDGSLSQNGVRRIQGALLYKAYSDESLLHEILENTDSDIKAIGNALLDVSGDWALMREQSENGTISRRIDVTANLVEAVQLVRHARATGTHISEVIEQGDIFEGEIDPVTQDFIRLFFRGENYNRASGRDSVASALKYYVNLATETKAGENIFGEPELTGQELIRGVNEKLSNQEKSKQQQNLFTGERVNDSNAGENGTTGEGRGTGQSNESSSTQPEIKASIESIRAEKIRRKTIEDLHRLYARASDNDIEQSIARLDKEIQKQHKLSIGQVTNGKRSTRKAVSAGAVDTFLKQKTDLETYLKARKSGEVKQNTPLINFSRSQSSFNPNTATTKEQVRAKLVEKYGEKLISDLERQGKLEIFETYDQQGIEGFYQNGKVTLIADALTDDSIIPTFLHELGGHGGFQNMMNQEQQYSNLMKQFDEMVRRGHPVFIEAKRLAERESDPATQKLEYLPYLLSLASHMQIRNAIQKGALKSFISNLISNVKAWLFDRLGMNINLNQDDMVALAERMINKSANHTDQQNISFSEQDKSVFTDAFTISEAEQQRVAKEIDRLADSIQSYPKPVQMKMPPVLLALNGIRDGLNIQNLPLELDKQTLRKITGQVDGKKDVSHQLTIDQIKQLPNEFTDPLAVLHSDKKDGLIILTSMKDSAGNPVISAIHLSKNKGRYTINELATAFGKENFKTWLNKRLDNLVYYKNKKSQDFVRQSQLQKQKDVSLGVVHKDSASVEDSANSTLPHLLGESKTNHVGVVDSKASDQSVLSRDDVVNFFEKSKAENDKLYSRNFDINKSLNKLSEGIKNASVQSISQRMGYTFKDWLGIGLQALGRRQLTEIYHKILPQLTKYNNLAAQMDADKNDAGAEADTLVREWAKLSDEQALAELMHDSTLAQMDPAKPHQHGDNYLKYVALRQRFEGLSPEAQKVYTDARDAYSKQHRHIRDAIRERILRAGMSNERKAELLQQMDADFFHKLKGVYFPLARFGKYVVIVRNAKDQVQSVSRAETMAEAQALRDELISKYPDSKVDKVTLDKDYNASRDMVGRGFMSNLYNELDNLGISASEKAQLEDTLAQLYLSSLPDLSWAKHGIHRKGTAGFSQDARRAFAQNIFHGAGYLAKLRYSDLLDEQLSEMQKYADDKAKEDPEYDQPTAQRVINEMNKRHENLMNPKSNPLSSTLTSVGFLYYLGLSPASAVVNLLQTPLVTLPVMGAKWGYQKSSQALIKASEEAVRAKNDMSTILTGDELKAYNEAITRGVIDVTQAHDLAGIAQGEDSGVMWKLRPIMRWASFLFHHAERFNRSATFIAAYRLARENGTSHTQAFDEATNVTYDSHFDYSSGNRPRLMQGNVAKVIFLFKQFGQNMIYLLTRQAYQAIKAEKPEERSQARKTLAGLITTHALASGVLGLPLVGMLLAGASMIGSSDDEPWDAEVALRNMLADLFGDTASNVIAKGVSRATPWDISGRVGLNSLILPDVQEGLEGQRWAESAMAGALGPVAGIGTNFLKGLNNISDGNFERGLEDMLPVVLKSPLKSMRYQMEGAQDKTGISILDEVGIMGVVGQALGFSPSDVRTASEGKSAIYQMNTRLQARRSQLLAQFSRAKMNDDEEALSEVWSEIELFNAKNPSRRITKPNAMQSYRNRMRRIDNAESGVYIPKKHHEILDEGRFAFDN